jgi:hypothetical protein
MISLHQEVMMAYSSNFGGVDVIHLTKDMVLRNVSEYQIFRFYCKNFIDLNKPFCSDLRMDKYPSCSIKAYPNGLYYKDFGTNESYNCFAYVQYYMRQKFNEDLTYHEVLKVIANDFGFIKKVQNKEIIPSLNYLGLPDKQNRQTTIIRIKKRDWKEYDTYWNKYHIGLDLLNFYNVVPVTDYWISVKNNELLNVYSESANDPAYSYEHGNGMRKILRPSAERQNKWISNIPRNVFSGYNQLDKQNKELVITKSLKDCIVWRIYGYNSIAPQSENIFLNENQFQLLSMRFPNIIINYDNDEVGLKAMKKFSTQFGIKSLVIPDNIKDISDYISIKGYDQTKKLVNNLKDYLI